jgi:hypothetical protein
LEVRVLLGIPDARPARRKLSRSSADQSAALRTRRPRVRIAPGHPIQHGRWCAAARNRSRKPDRPHGRRFDSFTFRQPSRLRRFGSASQPRSRRLPRRCLGEGGRTSSSVLLLPPVCKTGVYETGRSADERFESSGAHHFTDTRTWLNGRVPERHSGGVGSTPAVRANAQSKIAWEANLVKASRRKRGEVGSKPTPGANQRDDSSIGRASALQAGDAGSIPAHSTNAVGSRDYSWMAESVNAPDC